MPIVYKVSPAGNHICEPPRKPSPETLYGAGTIWRCDACGQDFVLTRSGRCWTWSRVEKSDPMSDEEVAGYRALFDVAGDPPKDQEPGFKVILNDELRNRISLVTAAGMGHFWASVASGLPEIAARVLDLDPLTRASAQNLLHGLVEGLFLENYYGS